MNASKILGLLINTFSKIPEYKSISQKPVAFMYNQNDLIKKEIRGNIPFTHNSFKQT